MTLSHLEHKRIAIWGLGAEGRATYDYLRARFAHKKLILIDNHQPENCPQTIILQDDIDTIINDIDMVIKAPGISLYHPLITVFRQHGISVTSASNIWFEQKPAGTVIAVTGSNGKSTTCALLYHILNGMGLSASLGGNIGTPLLELDRDADCYIVELSSYQTADLTAAPDIALLLNLFPEHLQWHQSHAQYFNDKCRLIRTGAKSVILNRSDPLSNKMITDIPPGTFWFNDPAAIHMSGERILDGTSILGQVSDITLPGRHNVENICAALSICKILALDLKECFRLAAVYGGLPHRLENIGTRRRISYINDSISTTPEAALAALQACQGRPVTLICGGQDRGQDYGRLARYLNSHDEIIPITAYETGNRLSTILKKARGAKDLTSAVTLAQEITPSGGIILLSPAAPSYDGFKNFEERGDIFRKLCEI